MFMYYNLFKNYIEYLYDYSTFRHVLEVSCVFEEGSNEWFLSMSHDLFEDTEIDKDYFYKVLSFYNKEFIFNSINCLTRLESETYFTYINRIKTCNIKNCLCKKIKLRDLNVNYNNKLTLKPSLIPRYEKALLILSEV